jgi:succinate-semialdehyde dehydrogenase/glutarate-semialdehyde dehydrogenase
MQAQRADAVLRGACVLLDGRMEPVAFAGRTFFACDPAILSGVPTEAPIMQEETFGPVFPVATFCSIDEAVAMADGTRYGLTATVFGPAKTAETVAAHLRASHAIVYTNCTMLDEFDPDGWASGGFKRSGWIWEPDQHGGVQTRRGRRRFADEIRRIVARAAIAGAR